MSPASGPSPDPLALVAIAEARERTIEALSVHFAHDRLSIDELEARLERATKATTLTELRSLVADLEPAATTAAPETRAADAATMLAEPLAYERVVAVMGELRRRGAWSVARELTLVAVFSDSELDLTGAALPAGVVDIRIDAVCAAVKLIIPPGVRVVSRMSAFMASVDAAADDATPMRPGAPVIRLAGRAVASEVKVTVRQREGTAEA